MRDQENSCEKGEVNSMDWLRRLDDSFCAYRIEYKTPIGMSLYQLIYGKAFQLPVVLEHKAMWQMTMDWTEEVKKRLNGLNEVDDFGLKAYESSSIYK